MENEIINQLWLAEFFGKDIIIAKEDTNININNNINFLAISKDIPQSENSDLILNIAKSCGFDEKQVNATSELLPIDTIIKLYPNISVIILFGYLPNSMSDYNKLNNFDHIKINNLIIVASPSLKELTANVDLKKRLWNSVLKPLLINNDGKCF